MLGPLEWVPECRNCRNGLRKLGEIEPLLLI